MPRHALATAMAAAVGAAIWGAIPAIATAQDGAALYADNCSACHQPNGIGIPPAFPALAGNENLADLALIVGNIHNGKNGMPAFPELGAEDLAALASYIRASWGNAFGAVTSSEAEAVLAALPQAGAAVAARTIWDGVFTEAQVARAEEVYTGLCSKCHGLRLNGAAQPDQPPSPAIARAGFIKKWSGQTLQPLFEYLHTKMPLDNPGQLTQQQTADVLAYMLSVSGAAPGDAELSADPMAAGSIAIVEKPD